MLIPILLLLATSTLPVNTPYVQMMSDQAVQDLPVASSSINALIDFYAQYYAVSSSTMRTIVKNESGYDQYAIGDHGTSYGLVQVHLPAHPDVSVAQAYSPYYALNFLAENLASGSCRIWTTCPLFSSP